MCGTFSISGLGEIQSCLVWCTNGLAWWAKWHWFGDDQFSGDCIQTTRHPFLFVLYARVHFEARGGYRLQFQQKDKNLSDANQGGLSVWFILMKPIPHPCTHHKGETERWTGMHNWFKAIGISVASQPPGGYRPLLLHTHSYTPQSVWSGVTPSCWFKVNIGVCLTVAKMVIRISLVQDRVKEKTRSRGDGRHLWVRSVVLQYKGSKFTS